MKIIIDISEEEFNEAKILLIEGVSNNIEYAVANGKPYEETPKGDLISRKALQKKLQENHDFFVNAWGGFKNLPPNDKARVDEITNCISEVVNAPTVDLWEMRQEATENALKKAEELFKRPQGEWKPTNVPFGTCFLQGFECECGRIVMQRENFCPDCGAQMVGGGENE